MTQAQRELLDLISARLWTDAEQISPSEAVLSEARKQALVPLIEPMGQEGMRAAAHYLRLMFVQDELVAILQNANIPTLILKGAAAAIYYAEPIQRTMGDIDLIVPESDFETAQTMLERSGCRITENEAASNAARHAAYRKDGITIELHRHFSHEGIDVERYVYRGLFAPAYATLDGHAFPMLPPLENGLVLLAHVAQHLRNELGLRQVVDWMMYVHAVLSDKYWKAEFHSAVIDCGLETLALVMTRMCQMYLGLSDEITWCRGADETLATDLMENLLVTGNFGHVHGSGSSVETVTTNIRRSGLFHYLQQQGERNWQAYQKNKALKPLCWAYQACRYIRRGVGMGRKGAELVKDYSRSGARYALLTRLGID